VSSNREDLTDVLTILAPEETPILSSANKQKASSTFVEWTVDSLAGPSTAPIREGADVGQTIGDDADAGFVDKFAGSRSPRKLHPEVPPCLSSIGPSGSC
jgi:hypothetical protein